ncbi:type II toxin-antitoxin system HicB family antitoxin, partial [Aerococcus sanguinicola]|uniref:type II toxin-antitoxin system HicB family antitoxin n=1 Tax=Aerococcus sanguinicola TaxID=119206 RepID=UPI0018A747B2
MKKVIYPCIITEEDNVYYTEFPDFEACFTDGESFEEAVINAKDVLEGTLTVYAKKGIDFPEANMDIVAEKGRIVFVDVWLAPILDRASNQAVKKTLT